MTFRGIQDSSGLSRMWRDQGILAWYVRGLPEALLPGASLITDLAHSSWRDDMLKS